MLIKYASWVSRDCKKASVLQLGCGYYSTPLLFEMSLAFKWNFQVYTTDKYYSEKYRYANVKFLNNWEYINYLLAKKWDLVFIDNDMLPHQRLKLVKDFIHVSKYVIMHDVDQVPEENLYFEDIKLDLDKTCYPWTASWAL